MTLEITAAFKLLEVPTVPRTVVQAADLVGKGLSYESLAVLVNAAGLTLEQVRTALGMPVRTLTRRKEERVFNATESASIVRLARILAYGTRVLGSKEAVASWLTTPNRALGGRAPITLVDNELGAEAIEDVLGRIDYGVIS